MSISAATSNIRVAGNEAGPDGGEREEDAKDGGALRSELRNFVVELQASEDS